MKPRPESPSESPSRRRLLQSTVWLGVGALASSVCGLVSGYLSNSLSRPSSPLRNSLGALADLPRSGYRRFVLPVTTQRFWTRERTEVVVYARLQEDDSPRIVLARCSHLGCSVRWEEDSDSFACPCHSGRFDSRGNVVSGPAPSALTHLKASVDSGEVFVDLSGTV